MIRDIGSTSVSCQEARTRIQAGHCVCLCSVVDNLYPETSDYNTYSDELGTKAAYFERVRGGIYSMRKREHVAM